MRLTNYWWLLIWLFAGGAFCATFFRRQTELVCGKSVRRWNWLPALILMFPYWMWATYRTWFGDTPAYRKAFMETPPLGQMSGYLAEHTKDQGFTLFTSVLKVIIGNSDVLFFGIVAAIQVVCMVAVFRKYSPSYWTSIFLFVMSTDYLSWMHNGMRQFLAVTLIFAGFTLLLEKRYVLLSLLILLASTIHGSALMMLPVVFIVRGRALNKKTVFTVLLMLLIVFSIDKFTPFLGELLADTQYSDMLGNEIWAADTGTNILRVLVYSMPALMAIVGKKYLDNANDPVMNICANCSLITMGLYLIASVSSGIYIGRLPIYTTLMGYMLVPWMIQKMFTPQSARVVNLTMVGAYFVFFYYQMHLTWSLI